MLDLDYEEMFTLAMQAMENMAREGSFKNENMFSVQKKSYIV